jgi:hypothetical protein
MVAVGAGVVVCGAGEDKGGMTTGECKLGAPDVGTNKVGAGVGEAGTGGGMGTGGTDLVGT